MDSTATVDIEEAKAISDETEADSVVSTTDDFQEVAFPHLKRVEILKLSVRDQIRLADDLLDPEPRPLSEALQNALRDHLADYERMKERHASGR